MELLDAFNIMLSAANEEAISDIETDDYMVAQLEPVLDAKRRQVLLKGYPFNTHTLTLTPGSDGTIDVPSTYMAIRFPASLRDKLTVYNGKVFDRTTASNYSQSLQVEVVISVPFEQLPQAYGEWIAREAAVEFEARVHGPDSRRIPYLTDQARLAKQTALNSEFASIDNMSGFTAIASAYRQ